MGKLIKTQTLLLKTIRPDLRGMNKKLFAGAYLRSSVKTKIAIHLIEPLLHLWSETPQAAALITQLISSFTTVNTFAFFAAPLRFVFA